MKQKWYTQTWLIAIMFALWFLVIPPIIGLILLILHYKNNKKIEVKKMSYMEKELYVILGQYLKDIRESLTLTLAEAAQKFSTTPTTIQRYEKGDRKISVEKIRELCSVYGVDADSLMNNAIKEFKKSTSAEPVTIAAHHDNEEWTDEELDEIEKFKDYVRSKRK